MIYTSRLAVVKWRLRAGGTIIVATTRITFPNQAKGIVRLALLRLLLPIPLRDGIVRGKASNLVSFFAFHFLLRSPLIGENVAG